MRCIIVVPTYNEAGTIRRLLDGVGSTRSASAGFSLDVLVVDDSSPDGTGDVVRRHPGFGEWVHLLTRTSKDGLGAAYRAGFAAAVDAGYDVVVQMDADGSHPVTEVAPMVELLSSHDVVVGSRYVTGGATENWPARRRLLSWAANTYARTVLGLRTKDATSGFRAWRAEALLAAGTLQTTSSGYAFQVENTWHAERLGLRLTEHPITFTERTEGASKMTVDVAREAAVLVLRWRAGELALGRRTPGAGPRRADRLQGSDRR